MILSNADAMEVKMKFYAVKEREETFLDVFQMLFISIMP